MAIADAHIATRTGPRLLLNASGMGFGGGAAHALGLREACERFGAAEVVDLAGGGRPGPRLELVRRLLWDQTVFPLTVARRRGFGLALNNRPTLLLGRRGSFYEANANFPKSRIFRGLLSIGRRTSRAQIYPSATMRNWAANCGRTAHVVCHGVRPEFLLEHPPPTPFMAIFPGWPFKHKRHLDVIRAFRHVVDDEPTARLTFTISAGDSLARHSARVQEILDVICRLGLGDHVVLTGPVAVVDMARLMAQHVVVLLLTDLESFGLPVIEARALGRHVLASDLPALRELAAPGVHFVENGDIKALARRWSALLREPAPPAPSWARTWDDVLEDLYRICVPRPHLP